MPTASPRPKTTSASALTAVFRKLRLNWRSAIVFAGIPKWPRIQAPTPMLASEPPGKTIPPPSCAHAARVAVRAPRPSRSSTFSGSTIARHDTTKPNSDTIMIASAATIHSHRTRSRLCTDCFSVGSNLSSR